jgi:hypothetical protein
MTVPVDGAATMRNATFAAASAVFFALPVQAARAADAVVPATNDAAAQAPRLSVVGTISPTWTDNVLFSRDNRLSDFYLEPDVSVRLDGRFSPDLAWRIYARTEVDRFARVRDGDEAFALVGARLTQSLSDWRLTLGVENRYVYAGVFQQLAFTAEDTIASVSRNFELGRITLSPTVAGVYRFADLPEARRFRLDFILGIEARLNERWSIVSTPFIEGYWFTDGLNAGRRDWISSASLGLKYNISDSVSLTSNVAYEVRTSNVPLRNYHSLDIGPRLSFAF